MKRTAGVLASYDRAISPRSCPGRARPRMRSGRRGPTVQIAILLDTSNSMDGLIAQAKTQLWNVVNEFVLARKDGRPPAIQVALFEYGKASLPPDEGFVRLVLPLTDDLDRVSEELFALKTQRGRRVLRLGDPRCRQPPGVERVARRLQGDLHRRQRAVLAGPDRFPHVLPRGHRAGHRRQHDLLWTERRGKSDRLERRCRPGRRPVHEHRPEPEGRRDPGTPGP